MDRTAELLRIYDEGRNHTDRDYAADSEKAAEESYYHEAYVADGVHNGTHYAAEHIGLDAGIPEGVGLGIEVCYRIVLVVVGHNCMVARHRLLDHSVEGAQAFLFEP